MRALKSRKARKLRMKVRMMKRKKKWVALEACLLSSKEGLEPRRRMASLFKWESKRQGLLLSSGKRKILKTRPESMNWQ